MVGDRSRYGLLVSALGAMLLIVSVFLPWYEISFTANGVAYVSQLGDQFVAQFGNAQLQSYLGPFHGSLSALSGQGIGSVSAHQALHDMNIVLIVLGVLALLDALFPLARATAGVPDGAGGAAVLLGVVAGLCVLFRMISPPTPVGDIISLSLREGAWLALLGSMMMVLGGLWPRASALPGPSELGAPDLWSGLSGWTPGS
jgi:hypothetical protein